MTNLTAFLAAVGTTRLRTSTSTAERGETPGTATMVEDLDPVDVRDRYVPPVVAWTDGIQGWTPVTWRDRRPVALTHVAAAASTTDGQPVAVDGTAAVVCSHRDHAELVAVANGLDVTALDSADNPLSPPELERAVGQHLGARREAAERAMISRLLAELDGLVAVDGHLLGRTPSREDDRRRLIGVVKSVATRYLPDEQVLYDLPFGHRTGRFSVTGHDQVSRYSAYLRIQDHTAGPWSHGLIRVETHDIDLIDPACAAVLHARQPVPDGDGRWDRHLGPIRSAERIARAVRPPVPGDWR